jgi:hypothetical protein
MIMALGFFSKHARWEVAEPEIRPASVPNGALAWILAGAAVGSLSMMVLPAILA